jgi:hypothetical protein
MFLKRRLFLGLSVLLTTVTGFEMAETIQLNYQLGDEIVCPFEEPVKNLSKDE